MEEEYLQNEENAAGFARDTRRKTHLRRAMAVIVALLFTAGCVLAGVLIGRATRSGRDDSLLYMLKTVRENYREEVSDDELYDRLYDALALDQFCAHYTPEEYAEKRQVSKGNNTGFGISLKNENGQVRVSRVVENSPVARAGIRKGMYVYSCGGTVPSSAAEALALMNAAEGSITVSCGYDAGSARDYALEYTEYLAAYCFYADSDSTYRFRGDTERVLTETEGGIPYLPTGTAYISLSQFEGMAAGEFEACLSLMKQRGRSNLIIDLRGNGGGYLSILCEIASHLLRNAEEDRPLVLKARYRDGSTENYRAAGNDFRNYFNEDSRITVLADESSASASEALMGALHDYGTCAYSDFYLRKGENGAKTYGKGVMQSHFTAPDGNVMLLTVANIYWPNGNFIHGRGITEADGAVAVEAPALCGEEDVFLQTVCAALS